MILPWKLSAGPDGIPLYVIKKCIFTLAKPIHSIFKLSLKTSEFPEYWKDSFLKPIFKTGSRNDVKNYRAVCNQSELPKMLDNLITRKLTWDCRHIILNQQHGFSKGRSTGTNLILYQNHIINALEKKNQVDSIYTDLSKAFDRVNHELLIAKLNALGITGQVLKWIESYLRGRTQSVKYGDSISESINVLSGVPQGSHLGPILFNLFVNDVGSAIFNSSYLLFADDLKVFRTIQDSQDFELLQYDLDSFSRWCDTNMLQLNVEKCYRITFSRMNNPQQHVYRINGKCIEETSYIKDLGVIFDPKMTFKEHIKNITSRALKMLGFLLRSSNKFSLHIVKLLYCALVRSIIEYNSIIWCPLYNVDLNLLESIQKKFLRYCAYRMGVNWGEYHYMTIMENLNLKTLEHRRLEADLIFLHKTINGAINSPEIVELVKLNVNERRTRNSELFNIPFYRTNYGQNESISRMLSSANKYCSSIELFDSSLASFRRRIKEV